MLMETWEKNYQIMIFISGLESSLRSFYYEFFIIINPLINPYLVCKEVFNVSREEAKSGESET